MNTMKTAVHVIHVILLSRGIEYMCYMNYTYCYCYCLIAVPVNGSCVAETDSTWRIYWPNSSPNTLVSQACPGGATLSIGES